MTPTQPPHTIQIVTTLLAGMGEKAVLAFPDRQKEIIKNAFDMAEEIQIEYRKRYGVGVRTEGKEATK